MSESGTRPTRLNRQEAKRETQDRLLAAARELFLERGFHAASVAEIAERAGYTTGAIYSNFGGKEDLFLAVYDRQVASGVEQAQRAFAEAGWIGGLERLTAERGDRSPSDERWLAVFLEFWAHVIRSAGARERFAELHARALEPIVEAHERLVSEHGMKLPLDARSWTHAMNAMHLGIVLERLTQPDVVAPDAGIRMQRFVVEQVMRDASSREGGKKR
jgi:AcrR family transcriptional regulator